MITIKPYFSGAEKELFEVFTSAITLGCVDDYSPEQIQAWVPRQYSHEKWTARISIIKPHIAVLNGKIVGYADIQADGYIDHFFVHGRFQGQGIGKALMETVLANLTSNTKAYSHVSITAKPFFERNGFKVLRENVVDINGVKLNNFIMEFTLV